MAWPDDTRLKWYAHDFPVATGWIALCLIGWALHPRSLEAGAIDAVALWDFQLWRLVTSALVHVDGWHLAGNVLLIFFFIPRLEDRLGSRRTMRLLVLSALGASAYSALGGGSGAGASGALLGAVGALLGISIHRKGSWRGVYHDADGYAGLIGLVAVAFVAGLGPRADGRAHLGGLVVGCLLADIWLSRRRPITHRDLLGRLLAVSLAMLCTATAWAPWDAAWHLHHAARARTQAERREALIAGVGLASQPADLHHAIWVMDKQRAPLSALEHRLRAIAGGRADPDRHRDAARLSVAWGFASPPLDDLDRALKIARQTDPSFLRAGEAYLGLAIFARAKDETSLKRWCKLLLPRHREAPLGQLCLALGAESAEQGSRAGLRWLEDRPAEAPAALVRWVEQRYGE